MSGTGEAAGTDGKTEKLLEQALYGESGFGPELVPMRLRLMQELQESWDKARPASPEQLKAFMEARALLLAGQAEQAEKELAEAAGGKAYEDRTAGLREKAGRLLMLRARLEELRRLTGTDGSV